MSRLNANLKSKLVHLQLELKSHFEDHDGYCSGADVDVYDDEITSIVQVSPRATFTDYEKISTILENVCMILPTVLIQVIKEYTWELTKEAKEKLEAYRDGCGSGSGYCGTGESFAFVSSMKIIEKDEAHTMRIIERPDHICFFLPQEHNIISVKHLKETVSKI